MTSSPVPTPDNRNVYGYSFRWTPDHHTADQLHPLIYTYDTLASDAVARLDEIDPPVSPCSAHKGAQETPERKQQTKHRDLFRLLQQNAETDEKAGRLWNEVNSVPEWVDWEQIARGQDVFWRYAGASLTALTFMSLLGGMGASRPVETLARTGGFNATVVRRRLLETTQHTLGVHDGIHAVQPGGHGWEASVRVRLLHASVRQRIAALAAADPGYYDTGKHGVPINDLDCIGTMNTFSATPVWLGLARQGIWLRRQEVRDYLALWRWVAHLMGTPHGWLARPETAKAMMESLLASEIAPSPKSGVLANNIILGLEGTRPVYASRGFMAAQAYWLNGRQLCRELRIPEPSLYHRSLVLGLCLLFMTSGYITRSIPYLDRRNIKVTRNGLYKILVDDKSKGALGYRARFYFKWIPALASLDTPAGEPVPDGARTSGALYGGIERTCLVVLVLYGAVALFLVRAALGALTGAGSTAARERGSPW